ncbi:1-acyl-sn-glycerol-3-phosphate acyltransferase [compost metagenome]
MTILDYITTPFRWIIGWFVASFWILAIALTAIVVPPPRLHKLWKFGFRMITTVAGLKIRVRGAEHIDPNKGYLYMTNHVNLMEPFIDMPCIPGWVAAIEKKENFKLPIYGLLIKAWGNIPIDRGDSASAKQSLEDAKAQLARGTSVAIMPEGTRSKDGKLQPFKKGGFHLAIETGATILPYAHKNLDKFNRKGSLWLKPTEIEVVFTPPVDASQYTKDQIDELMARVRGQIEAELALPMGTSTTEQAQIGSGSRSFSSAELDASLGNP